MLVHDLAVRIAALKPVLFRRILVFAGSFDPFARHHCEIVEKLLELKLLMLKQDPGVPVQVVIWPIGAYATKQQAAPAEDRRAMLLLGLRGMDVSVQWDDLLHDDFGYTSTYQMQAQFSAKLRADLRDEYFVRRHTPVELAEVWHVIGTDNVQEIKQWNEGYRLWQRARFIVIARPGYEAADLPVKSIVLETGAPRGDSGTGIRARIAAGQPWEHLVQDAVASYIKERGLYQPRSTSTKEPS